MLINNRYGRPNNQNLGWSIFTVAAASVAVTALFLAIFLHKGGADPCHLRNTLAITLSQSGPISANAGSVFVNGGYSPVTVTLPKLNANDPCSKVITVLNDGHNVVTITSAPGDQIDGYPTGYNLNYWGASATFQSNGIQWYVINYSGNSTATSSAVSISFDASNLPQTPLGPNKISFSQVLDFVLSDTTLANITIIYPAATGSSCSQITSYQTVGVNSYLHPETEIFGLSIENAVYLDCSPLSGVHPVVFHLQGSGFVPDYIRFARARYGEYLASHGIIFVDFWHQKNAISPQDATDIMTYMQSSSSISPNIDGSSIGFASFSSGTFAANIIAATNSNVKGIMGFDSAPSGSPNFIKQVTIPNLFLSSPLFASSANSYLAKTSGDGYHLYFSSSVHESHIGHYYCEWQRQMRAKALANFPQDPSYEPLIDPRSDPNGRAANIWWILDTLPGWNQFGGGRELCDTTLWSPPVTQRLNRNDIKKVPHDITTRFGELYGVAFWKKVFFGDTTYDYLFTPQWVKDNFSPSLVGLSKNY